jgi:hypothetical protein
MEWADTRVTHLTYFDRLATTVELLGAARSVLRQVTALADRELRELLTAPADRGRVCLHRGQIDAAA